MDQRALDSGGSIMADVLPTHNHQSLWKGLYYGAIDKLGLQGLMTKR